MSLITLLAAGANAQSGTTNTEDKAAVTYDERYCLAQADEQTWTQLGLTNDQIEQVKELQMQYRDAKHEDRGTENTMRGTADDEATPVPEERPAREIATPETEGKGLINARDEDAEADEEKEIYGHTGTTRTTDQLGYDDTFKEAMDRDLKDVLTTEQFDRYKEWCEYQNSPRGDRNTDMDR